MENRWRTDSGCSIPYAGERTGGDNERRLEEGCAGTEGARRLPRVGVSTTLGASVRHWAAAVSVAAVGGCRDEEGRLELRRFNYVARLYGETCTSLHAPISDGPA